MSVYRSFFACTLSLICAYSSPALGCTFVETFGLDNSRHIFIGLIVSQESSIYDGRSVLSLEVEPIHEFTPESQRLGRNYVLYPSSVDSMCERFYVSPQPYTEERYKVGSQIGVYGSKLKSTDLGDLAVGTHMISPICPSSSEVEMTTIPSEKNFGSGCLSDMFHIYRVLALFPTASDNDVDRGLRWLSDSWYQLPYEVLVQKYADPEKADSYLELRYGELLNSGCGERPKMLAYSADKKEKDANRLRRKRWFEYCEGRSKEGDSTK